jgi:hypothetical protein
VKIDCPSYRHINFSSRILRISFKKIMWRADDTVEVLKYSGTKEVPSNGTPSSHKIDAKKSEIGQAISRSEAQWILR